MLEIGREMLNVKAGHVDTDIFLLFYFLTFYFLPFAYFQHIFRHMKKPKKEHKPTDSLPATHVGFIFDTER
jgi:hypothetical protein